jgi:hypothetical protein
MDSLSKECKHCKKVKYFTDYHDNREMRDGKSSYCKPCASQRSAEWKRKNKDRAKDSELQLKYGISLVDHKRLHKLQKGRCAICHILEADAPRKTLFVDHCHTTGEVRGLICHHCNSGLGHFMDNVDFLENAKSYLQKEENNDG